MSKDSRIKCIHCGSNNAFVFLANPDPNKLAYRCRECTTSWS
ncbi:MAG: hypothetical protein ACE5RN_04170 [Nitrosopumilaceae archaeon]